MNTIHKLLLLSILIFGFGKAQRNFGDTPEPMPSVSSFSSYVNTPVSLSTGVPNISIPLFTLPTGNKSLDLPVALSYHIYNAEAKKPGSEVGLGWSLMKAGVISRVIVDNPDETFFDPSKPTYQKNQFNDIYYYDIPGNSGKFKFVRDVTNNTFTLNNISGNNVKIEYTRDSNNATLILNSFTITDGKGLKYIFEDYSLSRSDPTFFGFNYKSAFFLTKIIDENNSTVANFSYKKNNKYRAPTILLYQNCKLETISTNYGKIVFENIYEPLLEDSGNNDPYLIRSVSLLDTSSRLISKYRMEYSEIYTSQSTSQDDKRILSHLYKLDKNQQEIEKRNFDYNTYYNNSPYGNFLCPNSAYQNQGSNLIGLLHRMTMPEGGSVLYNFTSGETYIDNSNLQLNNNELTHPGLQSLIIADSIRFDSNTSRTYTFQVSEPRKFFILFAIDETYIIKNIHGDIIIPPTYKLIDSAGKEVVGYIGSCIEGVKAYNLVPGTYTFKLTGNGNGLFINYIINTLPPPYKNGYGHGVNIIGSIEYYDSFNNLKKTVSYNYDSFSDPNDAIGQIYTNEVCNDGEFQDSFVLYKNVKEIYGTAANNLGYTKYYFKTPNDYVVPDSYVSKYYNLVSGGLLYKQEVFNTQNIMTSSASTEYVIEDIPGVPQYKMCSGFNSKAAWIKSTKVTSKTFFDDATSLEGISETNYSPYNFDVSTVKETSPEGIITEKSIKYASDLSNSKLVDANMLNIPLEIETKVNGKLVGKSATKYDASHLYPSSAVSYDLKNQNAITEASINNYDSNGNPTEIVSKMGIPTSIIYGYGGTQPIAKITGAFYNQIASLAAITEAITASDADAANPANEPALLLALKNLRKDINLKNYSITTYTYDPLIGATSVTSPNGTREIYKYDNASRLEKVEDINGKLLKEYKYNYKHN